jgi:hypothetical protein
MVKYRVMSRLDTYARVNTRLSLSDTKLRRVARGPRRMAKAAIQAMEANVKVVANLSSWQHSKGEGGKWCVCVKREWAGTCC